MKALLFYRDYRSFTGGQLKVWDYFNHARSSRVFRPQVYLTPASLADNPWRDADGRVERFDPRSADALFIAGLDWEALAPFPGIEQEKPVLNLIQHVRHADRADPRFAFLSRRATRICVGDEVASALRATSACNGPIHVVPNGLDRCGFPAAATERRGVFIAGLKDPTTASALADRLKSSGAAVDCEVGQVSRTEFLRRMGRALISVTLPEQAEGFFLPPLEAMSMGCLVVCPDCIGNRSFCRDRETCLVPRRDVASLEAAVLELLGEPSLCAHLRLAATAVVEEHDIGRERDSFASILDAL